VVGSTLRLRKDFTRALLTGDAELAERVVRAALDCGMTSAEIDIELIAPALFMVGDKWARGEISVADEHLASEIVLRVLALQRAARLAKRRRLSRRVLLLAPEGERHVIGLNMAADLLYAAGYDTLMLGADVPLEDIALAAAHHRVDVIAFTATMPDSTERLDAAIDLLRAAGNQCGVLLGGAGVSFELAATWNATVCDDISTVVECVDALVHNAPLN
jgi:methanogenic corrinoid protein MtbC1